MTTKVAIAPATYTHPGLTATSTPQITYTPATLFSTVKDFKVYIMGQSDAALEPTKSLSKWITDTAATRKT